MAVQVNQFAPALFGLNLGTPQAIATNGDGTLVAPTGSIPGISSHPAAAGDTITLFATGLGPVDPAVVDGATAPADATSVTTNPVTVLIGAVRARLALPVSRLSSWEFTSFNVVVPAGVPREARSRWQAQVGGVSSADPVTIAMQ